MKPVILAAIIAGAAPAIAGAEPVPYQTDARIRTLAYAPDRVITVPVSTGVVTRIVLESGEKVIAAATGVPAKCDTVEHVWCIVADAGANEVWVKPKTGARRNNLELKTDRRDYSFELAVGQTVTYRVTLTYPPKAAVAGPGTSDTPDLVAARLMQARPDPKNRDYRVQSNGRGADITPTAVFDDGIFTYFEFSGNREVPTIFIIGSDGQEARTNFNMAGDYVVVQRLGRKFVLRLGKSVVSVWNEAFDAAGTTPAGGTTVVGVTRETVGAGDDH